jgi:hypothetical protein
MPFSQTSQAPGAEGGILPVVLDKAHIVLFQVEAKRLERAEIEIENVFRRRLQHDLILVVVLHAVRILAIATVFRAARWLHIGRAPGFRPDRTQKGCGMRSARTDFHVVGLEQCATLRVPILLQLENDLLKCEHLVIPCCRNANHRAGSGLVREIR